MREFELIEWIKNRQQTSHSLTLGIGDDCATFTATAGRKVLVTADMLLEGSCFILAEAGAYAVGRKAMAVNLSDIAAMAGIPKYAFVSYALPKIGGSATAQELQRGLEDAAQEFSVVIAGGDTNSWEGKLAISITMIGEASGKPPVQRSGARPGDGIFVTGPLGGSILGHHLTFTPKVALALTIHQKYDIHSMIDLSDGLSRDLKHIAKASGAGFVLEHDLIPVTSAAKELALQSGNSATYHALHDGEDFELCFTLSPKESVLLAQDTAFEVFRIGTITADCQYLIQQESQLKELATLAYEHKIT
jgi:thiamine-monophosphate kinase